MVEVELQWVAVQVVLMNPQLLLPDWGLTFAQRRIPVRTNSLHLGLTLQLQVLPIVIFQIFRLVTKKLYQYQFLLNPVQI